MLYDQLNQDYIKAMKAKESLRSSTLNFLRAQLKNIIIEKKVETLSDEDVIQVIKKQVKQRQDSIEQFQKAGRTDLADKEEKERVILSEYLPEEMSAEELKPIVLETIKEINANSMKDMGSVMKAVAEKVAGRADNRVISTIVKESLSQL